MARFSTFLQVFAIFSVSMMAVAAFHNSADANNWGKNIAKEIENRHQTFEAKLNAQNDPEGLMEFLHETISQSAKITMEIHDDAAPIDQPLAHKLDKADYINSYLYGPRQIDNYRADLKTVDIQIDAQTQTVKSEELLTETGRTRVPPGVKGKAQDFTSRTECESIHGLDDNDALVLMYSKCETDIIVDQAI